MYSNKEESVLLMNQLDIVHYPLYRESSTLEDVIV